MTASDFPKFFAAVNGGRLPFQWQTRLAETVLTSGWPPSVCVPTGAGKTSLLDIAVFTLAMQSERAARDRTAPMRTFFVIDRRVVVDEAFERASRIAGKLRQPADPVTGEVADRLRSYGGEQALLAAELRGGMYREHTWADAPNQPLLCISTVDQVGSRLLFRGYGVNRQQRPVQAAFVALDSLLVLDEAHLSHPFAETVAAARRWMQVEGELIAPPVRFVQMSATLGDPGGDAFGLTEAERAEERLRPRLAAAKTATFAETANFETDAAAAALKLLETNRTVAVVVNRVASARAIFERIRRTVPARDVILLTGRVREWDRAALLKKHAARLSPDRKRGDENRLCVVATQTIEVGADMDFDALVTEAASLDALRQRLGRVDRIGNSGSAEVLVLKRKPDSGDEKVDPIYGDALNDTWRWLTARAGRRRRLDCGTGSLDALLWKHPPNRRLTPEPQHAPMLLPAHLDALVQTNPEPAPDPEIAVFLHGPAGLDAADVNVVWRADLAGDNREQWESIVALAPPALGESLPLPLYAVRQWLEGRAADQVADVEGVRLPEGRDPGTHALRPALLWNGPDDSRPVERSRDVIPGCTVIVPATEGGADDFGWDRNAKGPVRDIADFCHNRDARKRPRLRLHPDVLPDWCRGNDHTGALRAAREILGDYVAAQRDETESAISLAEVLTAVRPLAPPGSEVANAVDAILAAKERVEIDYYPDYSGLVVSTDTPEDPVDDSDESTFVGRITLADHTAHVRRVAASFVDPAGLRGALAGDLDIAAAYHDPGKSDPRFQAMLYGGREREPSEPVLAKSGPRSAGARRRAAALAGWPRGARHEFVSAALLAGSQAARARSADWELVQHLVGAHHGFGRPFPPLVRDPHPVELAVAFGGECLSASSDHGLYRLDSGWADRFWQLVERYGYWGLAFLEALLRRADCVASRWEEEGRFDE